MINLPKRLSTVTKKELNSVELHCPNLKDPIIEAYTSLIHLEEMAREITNDHTVGVYTGYRDSNVAIVKESMTDFIAGTVEFFKKLIEKLIEFFKQASLYLASLFGSFDKFLDRNATKIKEGFTPFTIYGHEYTFQNKVPDTAPMMALVSDFNTESASLDSTSMADVTDARRNFFNEGEIDKLRGLVMRTGPIRSNEFLDEVKRTFRKGELSTHEIKIDGVKLDLFIRNYKDLKAEFDQVKKDRLKLESTYKAIEAFFARGYRHEYVGNDRKVRIQNLSADVSDGKIDTSGDTTDYSSSDERVKLVNAFYQLKWKQAQEISTFSFQVYTERVNALKEATNFYEKVIRKAIFNKDGGEENEQ